MKPELTQDRLKELLHYDPETGHFTWRATSRNVAAGSRAGTIDSRGYRQISVDGKLRLAHRIAFLYMLGTFPPGDVDHVNQMKDDNRWPNLRSATRRENAGNKGLQKNNTSGHRGVSWDKRVGKWVAYGSCDGRVVHLGYFTSLEEAAEVAQKRREEYFGIFASA
jgi:hypothetical protein